MHAALDQCSADRATLRTEKAQLIADYEHRLATMQAAQSTAARIIANRDLGPPRTVAAALVHQLAWRASTTQTPPSEARGDVPLGMMALGVAELARVAGVSENTAGTHLALLADRGLIRRRLETVRVDIDQRTGEILPKPAFITQHFVGPGVTGPLTPQTVLALAESCATFTTGRTEHRGGKRLTPRCPRHPHAEAIRHYEDRCAICGRDLAVGEYLVPAMQREPLPADDLLPPERSPNFGDHSCPPVATVARDVLLPGKNGDRSTDEEVSGGPHGEATKDPQSLGVALPTRDQAPLGGTMAAPASVERSGRSGVGAACPQWEVAMMTIEVECRRCGERFIPDRRAIVRGTWRYCPVCWDGEATTDDARRDPPRGGHGDRRLLPVRRATRLG